MAMAGSRELQEKVHTEYLLAHDLRASLGNPIWFTSHYDMCKNCEDLWLGKGAIVLVGGAKKYFDSESRDSLDSGSKVKKFRIPQCIDMLYSSMKPSSSPPQPQQDSLFAKLQQHKQHMKSHVSSIPFSAPTLTQTAITVTPIQQAIDLFGEGEMENLIALLCNDNEHSSVNIEFRKKLNIRHDREYTSPDFTNIMSIEAAVRRIRREDSTFDQTFIEGRDEYLALAAIINSLRVVVNPVK
jgi:hypothetical protein